jgi:SAM-dependent methyltransferase
MPLSRYRYERQFDTTSGDSLAQLSEWVPAGSTVLELGPAGGYFTRYLQESLDCIVDAVEIDHEMAEAAKPWCRRLFQGNLETLVLSDLFDAHAYDVVVLADVLEHLRFPEQILLQLPILLRDNGVCLISVPNIAYGGLIAELLEGRFDYRNEGLLDKTHLRFFTRHSLTCLLGETGWYPWEWRSVDRPFFDSEFRTRLETLPTALTTLLNSRPDLQCYQWLVKAKLSAPETSPTFYKKPFSEHFPVRIFWIEENKEADFDYVRSQVAWGNLGIEQQIIRFSLPKGTQFDRFRLRFADRPGFIRLYTISVCGEQGETLWRWTSEFGHLALGENFAGMTCMGADGYLLANLHSAESWLELPWEKGDGVVPVSVTINLGWPMSGDFNIARQGWERAVVPLRQEMNAVKALVATRDVELATRDVELATRDVELVTRDANLLAQNNVIAEKNLALAQLENSLSKQHDVLAGQIQDNLSQSAQISTLQNEIAQMRSFSWWLHRFFYWPSRIVHRLRNL